MDDIAALLEPQIPKLRRYAWTLLRNNEAAEDLAQDTLERAVATWHQRSKDGDLRAWLFAIQRNLFLDGVRWHARRGQHVELEALENMASPDRQPDAAIADRDALLWLDILPDEQRSVLVLVALEELSYAEVARALEVPIGTVMSRLNRAREKLRNHMTTRRIAVERRTK